MCLCVCIWCNCMCFWLCVEALVLQSQSNEYNKWCVIVNSTKQNYDIRESVRELQSFNSRLVRRKYRDIKLSYAYDYTHRGHNKGVKWLWGNWWYKKKHRDLPLLSVVKITTKHQPFRAYCEWIIDIDAISRSTRSHL